jgi:CheY-like chemotaxis protein
MSDNRPNVLIVDDDPGVLQSLELLLSDDCEVVISDSSVAALDIATRLHFDVVVTDFRMPGLNGVEFAAALKNRITPAPYMLMLTGTPSEVKHSLPGASELVMVLAKPFDPERMLRWVLQVGRLAVSRRQATSSSPSSADAVKRS